MEYLTDYTSKYWFDLLPLFSGNEYGTAAFMGNLWAESSCIPYRLQGDYLNADGIYAGSIAYTNGVDGGSISETTFVNDNKGYGVAQWTFSTRKQRLYYLYQNGSYDSIGSYPLSIAMITDDMEGNYSDTWNILKTATNIRDASDYVLFHYENPDDKSESVQETRAAYGQMFYDRFAGTTPPAPPVKRRKMPLWMYLKEGW